jgi:hypothetical protein
MKAPTFTGSPQRADHGDAGPRVLHWVRVLASTWEPPLEWLGFLSLWAGLDVAQYRAKRATQHPPPGEVTGDQVGARGSGRPGPLVPGGGGEAPGPAPRAMTHGYRSLEEQGALYAKYKARRRRRLDSAPTTTGSRLNITLDVDGKIGRAVSWDTHEYAEQGAGSGPQSTRALSSTVDAGLRMLTTSRRCIGNRESAGLQSPD